MKPKDGNTLDSLYNNRALVPDYAAYFSRWQDASARVRQTQPCALDVPYGQDDSETLDVCHAGHGACDCTGQSYVTPVIPRRREPAVPLSQRVRRATRRQGRCRSAVAYSQP